MKNMMHRFRFGRVAGFALLTVAALGATRARGDDFTLWARSMTIRFAGYTAGGTLTNFPVLVQFAEGSNQFHYADVGSTNAADLRFADATGTNALNYEIDTWNTNGVSSVWVQVPQLTDANTSIRAFYGRSGQTAPACTTNGTTWSGGFEAVWHLKESATPYADSALKHNAAPGSAPTQTSNGEIGNAQTFNGSANYLSAGTINLGNAMCLSAWVNLNSSASSIQTVLASKNGASGMDGFGFYVDSWTTSDRMLHLDTGNGTLAGSAYTPTNLVTPAAWHHVAAVIDRANGIARMYVDGVDRTTTNGVQTGFGNNKTVYIGAFSGSQYYILGNLDEVRIETMLRSSNWVWAAYMNSASNRVFNLYADAQQQLGVAITNPANNAAVYRNPAGFNIPIGVAVNPGGATVTNIGFYANATLLGNVTASPYTFVWNNPAEGTYSLTAVAYDNLGRSATSSVITATVVGWSQWAKKMTIRFAGYTAVGTLTNFPALVQFAEGSNKFHYADFGSTNAADLRFTDVTETNVLNYEIDTWNTQGVSSVWVQVPQLVDATTIIEAFYGRSGQTVPVYTTNGATWSGGFEAVWHLKETNGAPTYADSALKHNATPGSAPTQTSNGEIGNAQTFNGSANYLSAGTVNLGNSMCLSAWVNLNSVSDIRTVLASQVGGGGKDGFCFYVDTWTTSDRILHFDTGNGTLAGNAYTPTNLVTPAAWHHVAVVADRANGVARMYVDGVDRTTTNGVQTGFGNNKTVYIGAFSGPQYYMSGILDEVRIETMLRSSNWVWAAYMNSASNRTFNFYSNAAAQKTPGTIMLFW